MSLLSILKSIFGSKVNFDKFEVSPDIASHNKSEKTEVHIHLDGTFNGTVNVNSGEITINPNNLQAPEQEKIKAFIKNDAFQDCDYFLTDKDSALKLTEEKIIAKEIVKFQPLETVIPRDDFYILKAALVVREVHNQGKPVEDLKENIFKIYGERGRKICNLCTAGYYEDMLELYIAGKDESGFNKEEFIGRYNIVVQESAFSVFVHAGKSKEALKKNILDKLGNNKRYGNYYVNVHALNKTNIKTAETAGLEIAAENERIEITHLNKSKDTLFMRLEELRETV